MNHIYGPKTGRGANEDFHRLSWPGERCKVPPSDRRARRKCILYVPTITNCLSSLGSHRLSSLYILSAPARAIESCLGKETQSFILHVRRPELACSSPSIRTC